MARSPIIVLLTAACLSAGCPTGEGEGSVVGTFYLLGCDGTFDYGSHDTPALYDMNADFFVGEPIVEEGSNPKNRLDLRIQRGGNNIEDADSLYIQIADVRAVAAHFAASQGTPVGASDTTRATLLLYVTCPTFFGRLEAAGDPAGSSCPSLDASSLETLCTDVDYTAAVDPSAPFPPFSADSSCILFCRFGTAERGGDVPDDFRVNFGDTVQGLFHLALGEQRLVESGAEICADGRDNDGDGEVDEADCEPSAGGGRLLGRFSFEVRRGQVAQEFP
ncbi:MAG: hypothetical protein ABI333_21340 [bacterium]